MAPDRIRPVENDTAQVHPAVSSPSARQVDASRSPQKFRIRFSKSGDLRFLSHHDLMHLFERMFRRASLSIPTTQGFNPRPRMWFAQSLALGIAAMNEVLEIEISHPIDAGELQTRLSQQVPYGIGIRGVREIDPRAAARARRAWYSVPIESVAEVATRCDHLLSSAEHWIERTRPHPRRINIRPYVDELHASAGHLVMALWITPYGAARPEEVVAALGLQPILDGGVVIERTDLEICDEMPPGTAAPPQINPPPSGTGADNRRRRDERGSNRPRAIVDNPLSFET